MTLPLLHNGMLNSCKYNMGCLCGEEVYDAVLFCVNTIKHVLETIQYYVGKSIGVASRCVYMRVAVLNESCVNEIVLFKYLDIDLYAISGILAFHGEKTMKQL